MSRLILDKPVAVARPFRLIPFMARRIAWNQQRSFARFIMRISIVATSISVAVMIIAVSLVNGFQDAIREKVFGFWGHIRIQERQAPHSIISEEIPIRHDTALIGNIRKHPNVRSGHAFATRYGVLKTNEDMEGLLIKGVDRTFLQEQLTPFLQKGSAPNWPYSGFSRGILISQYTAQRLSRKVHDSLLLYFLQTDQAPRTRKVHVAGIYKTGIEQYDRLYAIADLRLIQQLNGWPADKIGGYELLLKDPLQIDRTANEIYTLTHFPQTWDPTPITRLIPNIFDWLSLMKNTRVLLLALMIAVAVINLITCLLILVLERVRVIGTLKALGATDGNIQQLFLRQVGWILAIGITVGALLGLGLLYLQIHTGFIRLPEQAYYIDRAAVKIVWGEVLFILGGTALISLIVAWIPSWLVRRIQPVQAIRFR
ncbi:MAG: ABC transporter permease [Bacteroidota bacterium]